MNLSSELFGKRAIVTGAGRGVGLAIAERFVQEGAHVIGVDICEAPKSFTNAGGLFQTLDVSSGSAVSAFFDDAGSVDILVNNAAVITRQTTIDDLSQEEWEKAFSVNLTGTFLMSRGAIVSMRRAGGSIVNVASQLGLVALPNRAAYIATKGAMLAFTRALAIDHASEAIRVNSLSPGAVATERILEKYGTVEAAEDRMAGDYPLGRIATTKDVAEGALFLASARSGFMTGSNLVIDGGYSAR
jgi:NAD(P)-dependent dehydrogenase (short-subunit alcohol dehydrogenase family)